MFDTLHTIDVTLKLALIGALFLLMYLAAVVLSKRRGAK